jgi:hypothetical protein
VLRDAKAWQLTEAGHELLLAIEKPAVDVSQRVGVTDVTVDLSMIAAKSADETFAAIQPVRRIEPCPPIPAKPKFIVVQGGKAA